MILMVLRRLSFWEGRRNLFVGREWPMETRMPRTYKTAHQEIMNRLRELGWDVQRDLKFPHATSPNWRWRLWFKSRAIHFMISPLGHFAMGNARSTDQMNNIDHRLETPDETINRIVEKLQRWDPQS